MSGASRWLDARPVNIWNPTSSVTINARRSDFFTMRAPLSYSFDAYWSQARGLPCDTAARHPSSCWYYVRVANLDVRRKGAGRAGDMTVAIAPRAGDRRGKTPSRHL